MTLRACPTCGACHVVRSRRRGLERVLSWIGRYPFRCLACQRRFFAR